MMKVFSVFDSKAASFGTPIFVPNRGLAVRSFSDVCADSGSAIAKHHGDYALYEIGEYDPNSGLLKPTDPPMHVVSASSVMELVSPVAVDSLVARGGPKNLGKLQDLKDGVPR